MNKNHLRRGLAYVIAITIMISAFSSNYKTYAQTEEIESGGVEITGEIESGSTESMDETESNGVEVTDETESNGVETTDETDLSDAETTDDKPDTGTGDEINEEAFSDDIDATPISDDTDDVAIMPMTGTLIETGTVAGVTWAFYSDGELIISGGAFMLGGGPSNTPWVGYRASVKAVRIVDGIRNIGTYAFYNFSNLEEVTIQSSVTSIDAYSFYGCSKLKEVDMLYNVTKIEEYAFFGCSSLTKVTISNSSASIGEYAFSGCSSLREITIPSQSTSITRGTFKDCWSLTNITMPGSVTSIGNEAFSGCSGLTSITIPDKVTSIGNSAFSGCSGLASITIAGNITSVGNSVFSGCNSLTSAIILDGVTSICANAFAGITSLEEVMIPDSVTSIGNEAFSGCSGLTSITIPTNVTSIGNSVFSGCSSLTSITIPGKVTSMGNGVFSGCSNLTSVTIADGVTNIWAYAFSNVTSLEEVIIPDSVTSIGDGAFSGCSGLTRFGVVINTELELFPDHSGVLSVATPNGITSIGNRSFSGCNSLVSITILDNVTSIGDEAFSNCGNLQEAYFVGATPSSFGKAVFNGTNSEFTIYFNSGKSGWEIPEWEGYKTQMIDRSEYYLLIVPTYRKVSVMIGNAIRIPYVSDKHDDIVLNNDYIAEVWAVTQGHKDVSYYREEGIAPKYTFHSTDKAIDINTASWDTPGDYLIYISSSYMAAKFKGESAILTVKPTPPTIKFNKLDKYYYTDNEASVQSSWTAKGFGGLRSSVTAVSRNNQPFTSYTQVGDSFRIDRAAMRVSGLKDVYTVAVLVEDDYNQSAVDTITFEVYNASALTSELGTSIAINNTASIAGKSSEQILDMRGALTLSHSIKLDTSRFQWAADDSLVWHIADDEIADVYYQLGAGWSKASENTAINPLTPIRVIGYQDGATTLTVMHKKTGMTANLSITVVTLTNKLYSIKATHGHAIQITYTNGDNITKTLDTSNISIYGNRGATGEAAIYEPSGIASDVMIKSVKGDDMWIGTIAQTSLISGEAQTGLYPMNSIKLTALSNIVLYAVKPNGEPYRGDIQIAGGLFKNGAYVPSSEIQSEKYPHNTTDTNGRIVIQLDTDSFGQISKSDKYKYMFEVRFLSGNYAPMLIEIDAFYDYIARLRSNASTLYMTEWDGIKPSATYLYNDLDVTHVKGSIGPSNNAQTGTLIARAALPQGKSLSSARIDSSNGILASGTQSYRMMDNLPFLTDISYAEIRWELDRSTVPFEAQKSFNIRFNFSDGSSKNVPMPFSITNMIGLQSAELKIPVKWHAATSVLTPTKILDGFVAPDVTLGATELDFNMRIEETNTPLRYKFYGYLGNPSVTFSIINETTVLKNFLNRYYQIKTDIYIEKYVNITIGFGDGKPDSTKGVSVNPSLLDGSYENLRAYVEGELIWNSTRGTYDMIIADGDMLGEAYLLRSVTLSIPIKAPLLFANIGVESGDFTEVEMTIPNKSEIYISNYTGKFHKLSLGVSAIVGVAQAGVDGYGKASYGYEAGTRYNANNKTFIQGRRHSAVGEWGVEWWAKVGFKFAHMKFSGYIMRPKQIFQQTHLVEGDNAAFPSTKAYLNALDMSAYTSNFLLPQNAPMAQGVALSAIPDNPWEADIAGDETFAVAAWESLNDSVSQEYLEELEDIDEIDMVDVLGLMNQTEIAVSMYGGSAWSEPLILTDDSQPDGSPVIAVDVNNKTAVVAWQRVALYGDEDNLTAQTEIMYSQYNGAAWSEPARLDYIGENAPTALQIAINNTGVAVVAGTINADDGSESSVTVYFVDNNENIVKTVLTNDGTVNVHPQIVVAQDGFYVSWVQSSENGSDILVKKLSGSGAVDSQTLSVAGVSGISMLYPTMAYQLVSGNGNEAAILCKAYDFKQQGDSIYALKLTEQDGKMLLSAPMVAVEPESGYWLEITGGELSDDQIKFEYAKMEEPEDPSEDITPVIFSDTQDFENTILYDARFNDFDVVVNSDLLVSFSLANIGTDAISSVKISIDGTDYINDSSLIRPGAVSMFDTSLTTGNVLKNLPYTISVRFENGDDKSFTGTLILAKPNISIGEITTLAAEKGKREFSVRLFNDSDVPLKGKGYEVRLSFYKDPMRTIPVTGVVGQKSVLSLDDLELLDEDGLSLHYSYDIPAGVLENGEIPDTGEWLYVRAEILDGDTPVAQRGYAANQAALGLYSLIRYGEPEVVVVSDTTALEDGTTADLQINNRSMQAINASSGIILASLLDDNDNIIEVQAITLDQNLGAEDTLSKSILFEHIGTGVIATFEADGASTPRYGITLNPYANIAFPSELVGYDAPASRSVRINNIGNQSTGALAVSLSGTDMAAFTLDKTSINSVDVGGFINFLIVPDTGLAVGTYTATVTVSGSNNILASFDVSFAVTASPITGQINIGSHNWNTLEDTAAFGLFYKTPKTATVTANGNIGETVTIQYYLSSTELTIAQLNALTTEWQTYHNAFAISPNSKHIIYVKLTGNFGGTTYLNSNGIVFYSDSAAITTDVSFTKGSTDNVTSDVTLNGNTVSKIMNGAATLVRGTDYTVSGGTITFRGSYLNGLAVNTVPYTLTIHYNPQGLGYPSSPLAGSEAPATTSVLLTINNAPPTVTGVAVTPSDVSVQQGQTQQFTVTVTGENDPSQAVTWSVTGGTGNTQISETGLLSIDSKQRSGSVLTVIAISTVDASKSGTATVTVTHSSSTPPTLPPPPSSSGRNNGTAFADRPFVSAPQPMTMEQALVDYNTALKEARKTSGSTIKIKLVNSSEIDLKILQTLAEWAARDRMGIQVIADQTKGSNVISRLVIDSAKATRTINLLPSTDNPDAMNTAIKFKRWFKNKLTIISTGQQSSYGTPVEIAVKVNLTGMDTANLRFYHYNKKTNSYVLIKNPKYQIDENGYLHFTTELAGDIIISEGVLEKSYLSLIRDYFILT